MAGFKAHMAFGMLAGFSWTVFSLFLALISFWFAPIVFIAGLFGSFLPDLDSDTGKPVKILLISSGLFCAVIAGVYLYEINETDIKLFILYTLGAFLFVYFVLGGIFKKLTHHRGIFHSIPAALLSSLLILAILNNFNLALTTKMAISLAVGIGYLSHLILDELNSVVNLKGIPFVPNKSSGSALKMYSNNRIVTLFVYISVIFLGYYNFENINSFFSVIF